MGEHGEVPHINVQNRHRLRFARNLAKTKVMTISHRPAILFVCLGNICRSPLAEGALRHAARTAGLDIEIDSAGTGDWHVGGPPDPRAVAVARKFGVDIASLKARQIDQADFRRFTHILALDATNLANIRRIAPADSTAKISLLLDMVAGRQGQAVADPYYGDDAGFQITWADVSAGADALLKRLSGSIGDKHATAISG
jgi:protein-tyrosine phosphatase